MRIPYLGLLALGPGTGNSESVVELETHILDELEKGSGQEFFFRIEKFRIKKFQEKNCNFEYFGSNRPKSIMSNFRNKKF